MRMNANVPAMTAWRNLQHHQGLYAQGVLRVSSGKRINSAADDPAGMVISQKLEARLRELRQIIRRTEDKMGENDTLAGELQGRQDLMQRMREIAVQANNGTLGEEERYALAAEFQGLMEELLDSLKSRQGIDVHVVQGGAMDGELLLKRDGQVFIGGQWVDEARGVGGVDWGETIGLMDSMLKNNAKTLASLGAEASRLVERLNRLLTEEENLTAAKSLIEDADLAKELVALVKEHLLTQSATHVLAITHAQPEQVLKALDII